MNRCLTLSLAISMTLSSPAIPLRAANKPRAGKTEKTTVLWTNEDLEKLRPLGAISIVGEPNTAEDSIAAAMPGPYLKTQDPEWYAEQAARLRAQLESNEAELQHYRQAIEDARSLKTMTGGINLGEDDIGITPEAGIEILQQRVSKTQSELDALEDLARRNDIPPGTQRGIRFLGCDDFYCRQIGHNLRKGPWSQHNKGCTSDDRLRPGFHLAQGGINDGSELQ